MVERHTPTSASDVQRGVDARPSQDLVSRMIEWRRDFHAHPELGFEEERTAEIVAAHLEDLGFEVARGVGGTGVVGLLRAPTGHDAVLARFDMDALPIEEATGLPFASVVPGRMHSCGHDGHVAIGMAVADLLSHRRDALGRHVKLVFQPAEEGLGGARAMLADGVMDDPAVSACLGLHVWNDFAAGYVAVDEGPVFAASDRMTCRVLGRPGHAAMPHATQDVIVAAAAIVSALQTIVSRNVAPTEPAVVSIASIAAGDGFNAMPEVAVLKGTVRTYADEVRELIWERIERIATCVADAHGCSAEVTMQAISPRVENDPTITARVRAVAASVVGDEHVLSGHRLMASEDMGHFLAKRAGCYVLIGGGSSDRRFDPHHSPRFEIDERALPIGVAVMTAAIADLAGEPADAGLPGESAS